MLTCRKCGAQKVVLAADMVIHQYADIDDEGWEIENWETLDDLEVLRTMAWCMDCGTEGRDTGWVPISDDDLMTQLIPEEFLAPEIPQPPQLDKDVLRAAELLRDALHDSRRIGCVADMPVAQALNLLEHALMEHQICQSAKPAAAESCKSATTK